MQLEPKRSKLWAKGGRNGERLEAVENMENKRTQSKRQRRRKPVPRAALGYAQQLKILSITSKQSSIATLRYILSRTLLSLIACELLGRSLGVVKELLESFSGIAQDLFRSCL